MTERFAAELLVIHLSFLGCSVRGLALLAFQNPAALHVASRELLFGLSWNR